MRSVRYLVVAVVTGACVLTATACSPSNSSNASSGSSGAVATVLPESADSAAQSAESGAFDSAASEASPSEAVSEDAPSGAGQLSAVSETVSSGAPVSAGAADSSAAGASTDSAGTAVTKTATATATAGAPVNNGAQIQTPTVTSTVTAPTGTTVTTSTVVVTKTAATPTVSNGMQFADPADFTKNGRVVFMSASGNIHCLIDPSNGVGCVITSLTSGGPGGCETGPVGITMTGTKAPTKACGGALPQVSGGYPVLPYDSSLTFKGVTCVSTESAGVKCSAGAHQFTAARAGITTL